MQEFLPDDICAAVRRGEMKRMIKWLRKNSVNAQDADGNSLLHIAVGNAQPDLVRLLMSRGASAEVPNAAGGTALMLASQLGAVDEVKLMCEHSADVNWQNANGASALHTAAAYNMPEVLSLLLNAAGILNQQTYDGFTPLMSAASAGADKCVRLLLDAGASTDVRNSENHTALRCAELKGRASTQLLLHHDTSPPDSPSEPAADAVVIKMRDGRRVHVKASSLSSSAANARSDRTEIQRSRRYLHRAMGLLTKDLCK